MYMDGYEWLLVGYFPFAGRPIAFRWPALDLHNNEKKKNDNKMEVEKLPLKVIRKIKYPLLFLS